MRCQTEISYFNLKIIIEENISQLQISMNVFIIVKILDSVADSVEKGLDFRSGEWASFPNNLVQTLIFTELKHDVDILSVLEVVDKLDYILMPKSLMNFDFIHQLNYGKSTLILDLFEFKLLFDIILVASSLSEPTCWVT